MSITPYSLFTAVLWSSAFILLLYFFRKNTRLLALTGVTPLLFLILGTALRCLFPIEFLHFTNVVGLEGLVAGLFRALRAPLGQLPLQVWEVLLLVWAAGSLGLAARTGFGAWKFHKKLRSYEPLEDFCREHDLKILCRIPYSPGIGAMAAAGELVSRKDPELGILFADVLKQIGGVL